jgi:toxin ParE1/3/4
MRSAILLPAARRDLREAVRWIASDNPDAAARLRNAVVAAAHRIGAHPEIGMVRPEYADEPIRFLVLTGYPYILVYNAAASLPRIARVLHGARDIPSVLGNI